MKPKRPCYLRNAGGVQPELCQLTDPRQDDKRSAENEHLTLQESMIDTKRETHFIIQDDEKRQRIPRQ